MVVDIPCPFCKQNIAIYFEGVYKCLGCGYAETVVIIQDQLKEGMILHEYWRKMKQKGIKEWYL